VSGDWIDGLTPEEREGWDAFVDHTRRETLRAMEQSAFVMSLVPGEADIKFAVELGLAIMLDKPLMAVVMPGAEVPPKLRLVADRIVEADVDVDAGRRKVAAAMRELLGD
jgi:hypothetical protein